LGDENAGERVIAEAGTNGQRVGEPVCGRQQADSEADCHRAYECAERQKQQPWVGMPERLQDTGVVADADAYAKDQGTESEVTRVALGELRWHEMQQAADSAKNEKSDDDETAFHSCPPFDLPA